MFTRFRTLAPSPAGGCLLVDSISKIVLRPFDRAQDRHAQHERDLPFPFALSLSKGKSTLSKALLRHPPPGEGVIPAP